MSDLSRVIKRWEKMDLTEIEKRLTELDVNLHCAELPSCNNPFRGDFGREPILNNKL